MPDIVFENTKWGRVVLHETDPQWYREMWFGWLGLPAPVPSFVPTYQEHNTVVWTDNAGQKATLELNPQYFATAETTKELMRRLDADTMAEVPYTGAGGNFASQAKEWWLVWNNPDGTVSVAINAGLLASQFDADRHQGNEQVATNTCRDLIAGARRSGQKLPQGALAATPAASTKAK